MNKRTKFLLGIGVIAALVIGWQVVAYAASLPGSNFEIDFPSANLKVDTAGNLDWNNVEQIRGLDEPSGREDDSYAGGAKEDDACPGTTTGSIPNNKSDLLEFGAYTEAGDPGFLNLYWTRVQEPSGTTLMDFELNQAGALCANGVNPTRTVGDLLIEYRIEQGGAVATVKVREWTGTEWGPAIDLTGTTAIGSINQVPIPASESELGALSARTFGEMQIDLNFIFDEGQCESFGSAFVKSRASDSFTSQLKDFIAPVPVNISNCGNVIIHKETVPSPDLTTTTFDYTTTGGLDPATFELVDGGTQDYGGEVLAGGYSVTEEDPGTDWATTVDCSASETDGGTTIDPISGRTVSFNLAAGDTVECTYTNTLQSGALKILKNSTKGGAVSTAGAVFSYDGSSVTDNGAGDEDPAIGSVCVSGLSTGAYTVNETSPPAGYGGAPADEADQSVTVVSGTNCTDSLPVAGATATFTNPPLADLQVNFRDGGSGETALTDAGITCDNTGVTADTTPATGWDASSTHEDIQIDPSPRTVTCTIVIDP